MADLVGALERVLPRQPGWRAAIVGTSRTRRSAGPSAFETALRERCARLGAAVRWLGQLPNDEVMAHYREGGDRGRALALGGAAGADRDRGPGQRLRGARLCRPAACPRCCAAAAC